MAAVQPPAAESPSADAAGAHEQPGATHANGTELVSLRVTLGSKVLFLALRENNRGRFLKLSINAGAHTARAKIIIPESGIADLRNAVASVARKDRELGEDASAPAGGDSQPAVADTSAGSGATGETWDRTAPPPPLISERLFVRGRRFFLDVLANNRGRYCKLSAIEPYGRRASVVFPASGLDAVVEAIDEIIAQAPPPASEVARDSNGSHAPALQNTKRELNVEGNRVVVEAGANRRGSFVRILDGYSTGAITLPFSALNELIVALQQVEESGEPTATGEDSKANGNGKSSPDA